MVWKKTVRVVFRLVGSSFSGALKKHLKSITACQKYFFDTLKPSAQPMAFVIAAIA